MSVTFSGDTASFFDAFAKAQAAMTTAKKGCKNSFFNSDYADVNSVLMACREALNTNGISVSQHPGFDHATQMVTMHTVLAHSSGGMMESTASMMPNKTDNQGIGSCQTYLRRYCLVAILAIPLADDDAESTTEHPNACPACGGPMWDNRATKTGKQPDFKCKDKQCGKAVWDDSLPSAPAPVSPPKPKAKAKAPAKPRRKQKGTGDDPNVSYWTEGGELEDDTEGSDHHPTWSEDIKRFHQLREDIGWTYKEICFVIEDLNKEFPERKRPRPSGMDQESRSNLLQWLDQLPREEADEFKRRFDASEEKELY